ncbi:MAG: tRNA (N6-isopentenyl adenosine(37)-C2)-methylthiotransferase MiaB [Planctomycetota bacterium]
MKVFVETFGCQMNKLDSDLVLSALERAGFEGVSSDADADLVILNTCSVRAHAEDKVYSRLGALARRKSARPGFILAVMGCMAQGQGARLLERVPSLDLVVGTAAFARFPEFVEAVRAGAGPVVALDGDPAVLEERRLARALPGKRRAFVSIMRGCENFCSYCVVPYVRGPEVSRPPDEILAQVRSLVASGVVEVTLLGQNVNSYGARSPHMWSLPALLRFLNDVEGLKRIRFITNHPRDMTGEILECMRDLPCVMESLHMPVQSGSNRILAAMNRGYTREHYLSIIDLAREIVPAVEITGDFIVGFPGETDADFGDTLDLLERCQYRNAYIFKYSPRPRTAAGKLPDDVPDTVKRARHAELLAGQNDVSLGLHARLVGSVQEVLIDGPSRTNPQRLTGRSRGDHIVLVDGAQDLVGKIVPVRIESVTALALYGRLEVSSPQDQRTQV